MTSEKTETQGPFYLRFCISLLSLMLIVAVLILGKEIILPLLFAILLATLLLPIARFLVKKGFHKILSIGLPVLMTLAVIAGVLYFLSSQIVSFLDDAPALKERVNEVSTSFQSWINQNTHIPVTKQNEYLKNTMEDMKEKGPQIVGKTFGSLTGMLTYVFLLPIYTFLILYYRHRIKTFIIGVFKRGSEDQVREVLTQSSSIAQKYVTGLLIETTIVFVLNTTGFLILGIKYAIFLALLAALLNLIPYVGMLVANLFCMMVTLLSSDDASKVLWVGVVLAVVQIIDNNFTMPWIVGNKVRINALVTIVGVLVGGAICGIPGMFLAIPGLAVMKVVFDKVPNLNPWGVLLGDESSSERAKRKGSDQSESGGIFNKRKKEKAFNT